MAYQIHTIRIFAYSLVICEDRMIVIKKIIGQLSRYAQKCVDIKVRKFTFMNRNITACITYIDKWTMDIFLYQTIKGYLQIIYQ